jgi:hypothetical protein
MVIFITSYLNQSTTKCSEEIKMTNTTKQAEMLKTWPVKLYVESINKDTGCSGTVFTTPSPLSEEYIRADLVKPIQAEPVAWIHQWDNPCRETITRKSAITQRDLMDGMTLKKDFPNYRTTPLYSADTIRALQLEAIRKTLEVASNKAAELHKMFGVSGIYSAELIACIDPEEILKGLTL